MDITYSFAKQYLQVVLDVLNQSYQCIGPTISDQALVFTELTQLSQLPMGYIDHQKPGEYRLEFSPQHRDYFSVTTGPQGIKPWLFKPQEKLWKVHKEDGQTRFKVSLADKNPKQKPLAFIGARACDLAALKLQDQHFLEGDYYDPYYAQHRENLLIVAVNCHRSTETCFCASTRDGPEVRQNFDLLLTELDSDFLLACGSSEGENLIHQLQQKMDLSAVTEQQQREKTQRLDNAAEQTRQLPDKPIAQLLAHRLNHKQWNQVAERCLSCGNCTMVCPSCFCHSEYDEPALDLNSSEHIRQWDSCFTAQHSYIAGFTFRKETRQHYRQWLTHKFSFWHDQYGRSGCTGCGRCISWCPVGIDVTEELAILCEEDSCHVN